MRRCFTKSHSLVDRLALFNSRGIVLRFCQGIACGLAHLHRNDCILPDLAARCVQVTASMSVKVSRQNLKNQNF